MIKQWGLVGLSTLIGSCCLFSGCLNNGETNQGEPLNYPEEDKEVISLLEKFADEVNLDKSSITKDNYQRNTFRFDTENSYPVKGYMISGGNIKPEEMINTYKFFDGWENDFIGDEAFGSFVQYMNKNLLCYYTISLEQEIPYELLVGEDLEGNEVENYDEKRNEFYKTATYSVELSCGKLPEDALTLQTLMFDASGQEPFWNATFRGSEITLFDVNGVSYYFPQVVNKVDEDIILSGYHINGTIKKENCVDNGRGADHEYSVNMDYITDNGVELHYEGCADKANIGFIAGEEGTLENFIKKTNYKYSQEYKIEDTTYRISEIAGNYMHVDCYVNDEEGNYYSYQIIMENVDGEWRVIFEGDGYGISDEECEELNQYDNNLMDMFFLTSCPRG